MGKLEELLAKIKADVVIRKTAKGNITADTQKQRDERRERDRRSSDPALTGLMRQANVDSKAFPGAKPDPYAGWKEVARLAVLQRQTCRCCNTEQIHVVGEMVHLRGYPKVGHAVLLSKEPLPPLADVWVRRSTINELPFEEPLWAPAQSIAHCFECLTAFVNCNRPSQHPVPEDSGQLPLLH